MHWIGTFNLEASLFLSVTCFPMTIVQDKKEHMEYKQRTEVKESVKNTEVGKDGVITEMKTSAGYWMKFTHVWVS